MYPIGTDDGSPPHVTFSGHQDGIRGRAGGNCAYIAQSYGDSIQEKESAATLSSSSGWMRFRR
ncbi:Uncharacterised protein [Mycobacterium tuberculosis]|nr:Uncharacterised protein [Mycobacterium tuberculosis]